MTDDVNSVLAIMENSTRRKILEALTREPHYPLQLSKELGISQPAIIKHLNLLEEYGLVNKHQETSRMGPKKMMYNLNTEFTLVMDMRNGMFRARLTFPSEDERVEMDNDEINGLETARSSISYIDEKLEEIEKMRSDMIRRRERMMMSVLNSIPESMGYRYRSLLYDVLNAPDKDVEVIFRELSMNAETAKKMMDDIDRTIKEEEEAK